jgi:virginiamycin A acetyltransferase
LDSSLNSITNIEKLSMSVLYVLFKKKIPQSIIIPLLSYLNSKNLDRRVSIYFFKKYFNINIGIYSYGVTQILNSEYRALESIGSFCAIANGLTLAGFNHPTNMLTTHPILTAQNYGFIDKSMILEDIHPKNKKIIIENDVWIGSNVTITAGVRISNGAIIGAGSVVTRDVPPYAIVVGVPAKVIKYRFSQNTINALLKIKWWSWKESKIKDFCKGLYYVDTEFKDRESILQKYLELFGLDIVKKV